MDEHGDGAGRTARSGGGSGGNLAAAGGLGVVALGILILGAFLRAQPPAGAPTSPAPPTSLARPLRAERPETAPSSNIQGIGEHAPAPIPPTERETGEPPAPPREPQAAPRAAGEPPTWTPPSPSSASPPSADLEKLALRARDDVVRVAHLRRPYMAQLAVSCEPPNVGRLLGKAGPGSSLYLLPAEINGRPCFRVCWGSYASAPEAAAATDLPAVLREEVDLPVPKTVAEVLP